MGVSQSKILEHITKLTKEVKELDIKKLKNDAVNIGGNTTKITDLMEVLQIKLDKIIEQEPGEEVISDQEQEQEVKPEREEEVKPEREEEVKPVSKGGKKRKKTKKHNKKNRKKTGKK